MFDMHRHDEFSSFDGMGKALPLALHAKSIGYSALGSANHGNTNGLVEHYFRCKEAEIKPIMGCEVYFQPTFDKDKKYYHLCLTVKNLKGYENLNRIITLANSDTFYRKPIVTFALLKKYSEGLICSSACVGGFIPQMLLQNKERIAEKALNRFMQIYKNDFYIEIQPYKISEEGMQEKLNMLLIELASRHKVALILTSDSHYGPKADYPTYLKMHEIGGRNLEEIAKTYKERYMPEYDDLYNRFVRMHKGDFGNVAASKMAKQCYKNLEEVENKVDDIILELLPLELPIVCENSKKRLMQNIIKGLKKQGIYKKEYIERCKMEYHVITTLGFEDYFLIVEDYAKYAKYKGIAMGPGRGSVCNCLVAFALEITKVDSLYFKLDFNRFLRLDKKKMPDIDLDFETARRQEIIDYLVEKYKGKAIQICSYGMFKVDNLINDLSKVCGVDNVEDKVKIKNFCKEHVFEEELNRETIAAAHDYGYYNRIYDNIILHFTKLYNQVRFIGTHAAGVAIVRDDIAKYVSIQKRKDMFSSSYDLGCLEKVNAAKFDLLGLKSMSEIGEMEKLSGDYLSYEWFKDPELLKRFAAGETTGVFQYESSTARGILIDIVADTFAAVVAGSAMNRPGPLSMKQPKLYGDNKRDPSNAKNSIFWEYTKESYGTVIYQEQIIAICKNIANMEYADIDKILKLLKTSGHGHNEMREKEGANLRKLFTEGCQANGMGVKAADDLFNTITVYSFNQGHAVGYTIISFQDMYYKVYHPMIYWYAKLKYASDLNNIAKFKVEAVQDGCLIMLPHVNYKATYSINKIEGDKAIFEGLSSIKNVGEKAAICIETERKKNGPFLSYDDFLDRVPKRSVNARVVAALKENGALEFNKKTYLSRTTKYNSVLYMKGMNK